MKATILRGRDLMTSIMRVSKIGLTLLWMYYSICFLLGSIDEGGKKERKF
jgi:bacteriorhodopsin